MYRTINTLHILILSRTLILFEKYWSYSLKLEYMCTCTFKYYTTVGTSLDMDLILCEFFSFSAPKMILFKRFCYITYLCNVSQSVLSLQSRLIQLTCMDFYTFYMLNCEGLDRRDAYLFKL